MLHMKQIMRRKSMHAHVLLYKTMKNHFFLFRSILFHIDSSFIHFETLFFLSVSETMIFGVK